MSERHIGVYRCYSADGTLLYVGKSVNPRRRMSQHRGAKSPRTQEWIRDCVRVEVRWFADPAAADVEEGYLICHKKPRANVQQPTRYLDLAVRIHTGPGYTSW